MRPVHGWGMRLARSVVVLVVAGVCWALFVKQTKVEPTRMAALAVRTPHFTGVEQRPKTFRPLPVSISSVKAVKVAGKRQPDHTGIFEVGWESAAKAKPAMNAVLLLQMVPSTSLAQKVLTSVQNQYSGDKAVQGGTYTLLSHFPVAGVPGAEGVVYSVTSSSSSAGTGIAEVVTFRVGTVAVLELIQTTGNAASIHPAVDLARAEGAKLRQVGTGLSLRATSRPLGWTLVLAGGAVVASAGVAVVPEWVLTRTERRRHRLEHRARQRAAAERRARGRRAVRRHRPPAWQQQHRRAGGARFRR